MANPQNLEPPPTLLFFSGLGADAKLFAMQKIRFPGLIAPDWQLPRVGESLDDYLTRWLEELKRDELELDDLAAARNVIVGGVSFGGLIAQRVAKLVGARDCILFGSIKLKEEVPKRLRWLRPLHYLAYLWVIRFWQTVVAGVVWCLGRFISRSARTVLGQFCRLDPFLVQWSLKQLFICFDQLPQATVGSTPSNSAQSQAEGVSMAPSAPTRSRTNDPPRIHQIHGEKDRVFPARLLRKQPGTDIHLLPQAGHLMTLFESDPVNKIISKIIGQQSEEHKVQ